MNCNKCGAPLEEGVTSCPACGAPLDVQPTVAQPVVESAPIMEKPDTNMKVFAILAYVAQVFDLVPALGWVVGAVLVLIPIFMYKNSYYAKSHANNALILLIINVAKTIIGWVLAWIPVVDTIWSIASWAIWMGSLVLAILGIVAAAKDEDGSGVAVIGQIKILK